MENKSGEAKVQKVRNWSPVWIFPIVTALIGAWILFYHYSHQGPEVTLITTNAEGIEGGKTTIKSRSVDVGVVESATLTDDLTHVEIKARLNAGMEKLLHEDSVFWAGCSGRSWRTASIPDSFAMAGSSPSSIGGKEHPIHR